MDDELSQISVVGSADFQAKNDHISSPYSNFTFEQQKKLSNFHRKIEKCGVESYNLVGCQEGQIKQIELPVYCNNRSCDNPGCKKHRKYLYKRKHKPQFEFLKEHIKRPKSYVFSGWNIPLHEWSVDFTRSFCRGKLRRLYQVLKELSVTEFSVHMEVKFYPEGHKKYGVGWLHFHVVSGYIDVHKARALWKRVVKYETAIKFEYLEGYISKYASKTPALASDYDRDLYHLLVYKSQMHRYSIALSKCEREKRDQQWFLEDLLEREVYNCISSDIRRNGGYNQGLVDYEKRKLNEGKPPPPSWSDLVADTNEGFSRDSLGYVKSKKRPSNTYPLDSDGNYQGDIYS